MKYIYGLVAVALGVTLSAVADIFLKKSGLSDVKQFALGFALYALAAFPIAVAFKYADFGVVYIIWESLAVASGVIIGILLFHEPSGTFKYLALLSALAAIIFSYFA